MGTTELAFVGLAGSSIGAALSVPMVWSSARRPADVRLIGAGLLGLAAAGVIISARVIGFLPATPAVNHLLNLVGLLSYPFIYFYIREDAGRPLPRRQGWVLWIPAALYFALWIVRAALGVDTRVPFLWLLPVMLAFTASCAMAADWRRARSSTLVPGAWLVVFFAILNSAQIVRMLFGHVPLVPALIPAVVALGFAALTAFVAWRSVERLPDTAELTAPRYAKSALDEQTAQALLARVEHALVDRRLFTKPGLTLSDLAGEVESTPHQVSEVLNRYGGVSFHERLKRCRVADVKTQLLDPANDKFTIEGIGESAGFGSRSALYAAFRQIEGVTPKELRDRRR